MGKIAQSPALEDEKFSQVLRPSLHVARLTCMLLGRLDNISETPGHSHNPQYNRQRLSRTSFEQRTAPFMGTRARATLETE